MAGQEVAVAVDVLILEPASRTLRDAWSAVLAGSLDLFLLRDLFLDTKKPLQRLIYAKV